jgi:hypothetical protein
MQYKEISTKYKIKGIISGIVVSIFIGFTILAHAEDIAVDDWWLQTDTLGGLRQSVTDPNFYFAVAKDIHWSPTNTYETIDGYHIASTAEGLSVFNQRTAGGISTYKGQGGWSNYDWEGVSRWSFFFSDTANTGAFKHAGHNDGYSVQRKPLIVSTPYFAGFVMVKDAEIAPKPASLVLLAMGLGLMRLGLSRR